jgi:hypothetical protein
MVCHLRKSDSYNDFGQNYKNPTAAGRAVLASGGAGIDRIFLQVVVPAQLGAQSRRGRRDFGTALALSPHVNAVATAAADARA